AAIVVALLVIAFNVVLAKALDRDLERTLRSKAAAAVTTTDVSSGRVVVHDAPNDAAIDSDVWVYAGARAIVRPAAGATVQHLADVVSREPGAFAKTPDGEKLLHSVALAARADRRLGAVVVAASRGPYDLTTDVALAPSVGLGGLLPVLVGLRTWRATGRGRHP